MSLATNPTAGPARPGSAQEVQPDVTHWTDKASRPNNEDFYTVPPYDNLPGAASGSAADTAARGLLYVVADGMGGAARGELASRLAVRSLVETYSADPDPDLRSSLWRAIRAANEAVYRQSLASPVNQGMGTTLTALVLHENKVYFGHVGDSRLYRLRGQHLQRLSHDHSLVQELVDKGTLTLEQARLHPERNKIQRAIGTGPMVDIDTGAEELALGDVFLLSTDGLHDELSDAQIQHILTNTGREAPQRLGRAALSVNGGPDNITAVWVRVGPRPPGVVTGRPKPWWGKYAYPLAAALVALVGVGWWVRGGKAGPMFGVAAASTRVATDLPQAIGTQGVAGTTSPIVITTMTPVSTSAVATETQTSVTDTPVPTYTASPSATSRPRPSVTSPPIRPTASASSTLEERTQPEPQETDSPRKTARPPTALPPPTAPPPTAPPQPTEPPPPLPLPTPPTTGKSIALQRSQSGSAWESVRDLRAQRQARQIGADFDAESPASDHVALVLPAFSGSVRNPGSQEGDVAKNALTVDSSLDPDDGRPLGLLQFNLASLPQRWIEGAKLELVLKKKGKARDTSAWSWTVDVLDPTIHEKAWVETRYTAFNFATPVKGAPIVLRYADLQEGIRSASAFDKCEAVQAMNGALVQAGGGALVGLRIEAGGDGASAIWHSGQAEPTLRPQLALELGPEGGPTPTICPVDPTSSPPSPTVSLPSPTPTAATVTPSTSPSVSATPVPATNTSTPVTPPTDQPVPSATPTAVITPSATATPSPTLTRRPLPIYLPLAIKGTKILPNVLNMVRAPDPGMGQGAVVLPSLATCENSQGSTAYAYVAVDSTVFRSQNGEAWSSVNDLDDLSITDIALTSNCEGLLVAKWGGGVYSGRPEANSLQAPQPSSPPQHKYPYAVAADSSRVVYGATLANNDTGGVFESPVPLERGSLSWTRMGTDLLDVRSLLLAGEQEVYAGTIGGAWTYKFRTQRWEPIPPVPPKDLAKERVLSILLVGNTPARRMILLGTAGEGLWQKVGDTGSPATNWPSDLGKASVTSLTAYGDLVVAAVNGHGVYYSRSTPPQWALLERSPKNAARVAFLKDDLLVVARDGGIWLLEDAPVVLR